MLYTCYMLYRWYMLYTCYISPVTAVSRGIHRVQTSPVTTLRLPGRWWRAPPGGGREGNVFINSLKIGTRHIIHWFPSFTMKNNRNPPWVGTSPIKIDTRTFSTTVSHSPFGLEYRGRTQKFIRSGRMIVRPGEISRKYFECWKILGFAPFFHFRPPRSVDRLFVAVVSSDSRLFFTARVLSVRRISTRLWPCSKMRRTRNPPKNQFRKVRSVERFS